MRRQRVVLGAAGALLATTVLVGGAVEVSRQGGPTPEDCVVTRYAVYATDEAPANVERRALDYANLTAAESDLFDRARAAEGEPVQPTDAERRAAERLAHRVVVHDGTVYRSTARSDCPPVPGLPRWLAPVLRPFVVGYRLLSGPLLPAAVGGTILAAGYLLRDRLSF